MDCIFCKMILGEISINKVYEDDNVLAFLDQRPKAKGHTLVIHKIHTPDLIATPDEVIFELMQKIKMIAQKVMQDNGASGFNLVVNNGATAGQEVFHLHFHIIPRA